MVVVLSKAAQPTLTNSNYSVWMQGETGNSEPNWNNDGKEGSGKTENGLWSNRRITRLLVRPSLGFTCTK